MKKPPISPVNDELVRAGIDHTDLVQPERVEPQAVLGIVFTPAPVLDGLYRLKGMVIPLRKATIDKLACRNFWLGRAELSRPNECS